MAFPVSRFSDLCIPHPTCPMPFAIALGSPNTYCNGLPVSFVGAPVTPHLLRWGKWCIPHFSAVAIGAGTVFVNGSSMARVTSLIQPACTAVAKGSINVFVGI